MLMNGTDIHIETAKMFEINIAKLRRAIEWRNLFMGRVLGAPKNHI